MRAVILKLMHHDHAKLMIMIDASAYFATQVESYAKIDHQDYKF